MPLIFVDRRGAVRLDSIEERNKACGNRLGSGEQIKAKRVGKGGWQTVERDEKPGSISRTGVACQPLFPGETPMRQLRTGQNALRRCGGWLGLGADGEANGLAADHTQPSSPDATA